MLLLKANTAVDVLVGPFLDDTDGKTTEEGLTISQADVLLSKNGQALAQKNDSNAATHDDHGMYNCPLNATDTATEGSLVISIQESGALPVWHECMVMAEAAYDSLFAAKDTGYMDVNVKAVSEDTTAADNLESACDNYSVTRGLSGTALPAAAADAAGGLPISDAGGLDLDTLDSNVSDILTDTGTTIPGTITTVDTVVDAIKAVTDNIPDSGALTTLDGKIDTIDGIVDNIVADTGELQTDWTNGGRLDLLIDAIKAVTDAIPDSGALTTLDGKIDTIDGIVDDILADTNEIQGDTHNANEVWDATSATLSISFETMLDRIYRFLMNKMNITDATGSVALRNEADSANIATQTVTDDDTTTTRTALSW